ncbi:hypothetical protein Catovirus_1_920 [Catovirus CTV1]|uniref:Uncharacterized protein n=1 Tax=Catovirus CTV1 TaxID=1977631 RepID=A0A1V0SAW6_9VIRU|nr:hypothetical protein Catovirus_1_920 [Catovirus CTV1]
MNNSGVQQKINKYQQKLDSTDNMSKREVYQKKIDYYKSLQQVGGDSKYFNTFLENQKKQAENEIKKIVETLSSNNVGNQLNELMKSSEELKTNYANLGNDLRSTMESYAGTINSLTKGLEGLNVKDITKEISQIQNAINAVPKTIDDIILISLLNASPEELSKYGVTPQDLEEFKNRMNVSLNQQEENTVTNNEQVVQNTVDQEPKQNSNAKNGANNSPKNNSVNNSANAPKNNSGKQEGGKRKSNMRNYYDDDEENEDEWKSERKVKMQSNYNRNENSIRGYSY